MGSPTVSKRTMTSSALSSTRFQPINSSSNTISTSFESTSNVIPQKVLSPLSGLETGNLSIGVQTTLAKTSSTLLQSRTSSDTTSSGILDLNSLSSNTPVTSIATLKGTSDGLSTILPLLNSRSLLHLPSNAMSSDTRVETRSVSSTSKTPTEVASATAQSNSTTSENNLSSLLSSPARTSMMSSSPSCLSTKASFSLSSYHSTAASTTIATMKSSGITSLTANPYVAIPTTSLSPNDAAAIAGGVAIAEGLAFLSVKYRGISDEAGLEASKTEFIDSIGILKSNLERLSLDLGGGGSTTCPGSKSRFRHRRRSTSSGLLDTITRAVCSLTTAQTHLVQVPPDLGLIGGDLAVIGNLADEMANEEEEEEEEEEEKKQSQSAEEKASETASSRTQSPTSTMRISTTDLSTSASSVPSSTVSSPISSAVSSVPDSLYDGPIQVDPTNYTDSETDDEDIFAMAGLALQAAMGGSNNITSETSNLNTSMTARTISSLRTTSINSVSLAIPDKGRSGIGSTSTSNVAAVTSVASVSRASSASVLTPSTFSSVSAASASFISRKFSSSAASVASAVSVIGASSISATSAASAASASRVSSISAASASAISAPAASFPSQIASNQGSSSLCKSLGGNSTCVNAYHLYNPNYNYTRYTSYVDTVAGFKGEWLGWGCAAMFKCNTNEAYAKGMTGQQILNAFTYLYAEDGVGVCGSVYMANGCYLTVNACDSCESSIPCDALPAQYQPPNGGVRCYYEDGTTWPPTPELEPKGGSGRQPDKRNAH